MSVTNCFTGLILGRLVEWNYDSGKHRPGFRPGRGVIRVNFGSEDAPNMLDFDCTTGTTGFPRVALNGSIYLATGQKPKVRPQNLVVLIDWRRVQTGRDGDYRLVAGSWVSALAYYKAWCLANAVGNYRLVQSVQAFGMEHPQVTEIGTGTLAHHCRLGHDRQRIGIFKGQIGYTGCYWMVEEEGSWKPFIEEGEGTDPQRPFYLNPILTLRRQATETYLEAYGQESGDDSDEDAAEQSETTEVAAQ